MMRIAGDLDDGGEGGPIAGSFPPPWRAVWAENGPLWPNCGQIVGLVLLRTHFWVSALDRFSSGLIGRRKNMTSGYHLLRCRRGLGSGDRERSGWTMIESGLVDLTERAETIEEEKEK